MSKLLQIWKNKKLILDGIRNKIFKQEDVEGIYAFRMGICQGCEHFDGKCFLPGTDPCCGSCGCSLALKCRSLAAACPEGYWDAVLSQAEADEFDASLPKIN